MKKTILLLLLLSGCSSTPDLTAEVRSLKQTTETLTTRSVESERRISELQTSMQFNQDIPTDDRYEIARLKNMVKILDDALTRDIRDLRDRLQRAEQAINAQRKKIQSLEEAIPEKAEKTD